MYMIKSSAVNYFNRYQLCLILLCVFILVMVILLQPAVISGEPLITYLRTYSMEQSPSSTATQFPASQDIPAFYGT